MGLIDFLDGALMLLLEGSEKLERTGRRKANENLRYASKNYDPKDRETIERYREAQKNFVKFNNTVEEMAKQRAKIERDKAYEYAEEDEERKAIQKDYNNDLAKIKQQKEYAKRRLLMEEREIIEKHKKENRNV